MAGDLIRALDNPQRKGTATQAPMQVAEAKGEGVYPEKSPGRGDAPRDRLPLCGGMCKLTTLQFWCCSAQIKRQPDFKSPTEEHEGVGTQT